MSHSTDPGSISAADSAQALAAETRRLADRLRGLPGPRLCRPLPPYGTCADGGRRAAQVFADLAQGVEERRATAEPAWRTLPTLRDHAVGDQVGVTGHDAVAAVRDITPDAWESATAWTREGRRPASAAVTAALDELRAIRLAID